MYKIAIVVNSDNIETYLKALEKEGARWSEGQPPTEFNPLKDIPHEYVTLFILEGLRLKYDREISGREVPVAYIIKEIRQYKDKVGYIL